MIDAYLLSAAGKKLRIKHDGVMLIIERNEMRVAPNGPIAVHQRHSWALEGERYLVMKIDSPVTVRVESADESRTFGPFQQLWLVDGMVLHDLEQPNSDAELDDATNVWITPDDRKSWERAIFSEA